MIIWRFEGGDGELVERLQSFDTFRIQVVHLSASDGVMWFRAE